MAYMSDGYGGDSYDLQSIPNSYDQPVYQSAVTNDIATQGAAGSSVENSPWGGYFRDLTKTVLTYAVKKDAFQTGMTQQAMQQRQPAPYYMPGTRTASSPGLTTNQIILFGGLFAAVMILKK